MFLCRCSKAQTVSLVGQSHACESPDRPPSGAQSSGLVRMGHSGRELQPGPAATLAGVGRSRQEFFSSFSQVPRSRRKIRPACFYLFPNNYGQSRHTSPYPFSPSSLRHPRMSSASSRARVSRSPHRLAPRPAAGPSCGGVDLRCTTHEQHAGSDSPPRRLPPPTGCRA